MVMVIVLKPRENNQTLHLSLTNEALDARQMEIKI